MPALIASRTSDSATKSSGLEGAAGELVEGAFYDKDSESTWAPARELVDFV